MGKDDWSDPVSFLRLKHIAHYYGDTVRQLFMASAALSIVSLPLLGAPLHLGAVVEILFDLVLVCLAGLTRPHGRGVLWADAAAAGAGVFFLELAAVVFYSSNSFLLFIVREGIAVVLLFAFYFSVKTLRAMSEGTIGHESRPGEFDANVKEGH